MVTEATYIGSEYEVGVSSQEARDSVGVATQADHAYNGQYECSGVREWNMV